MLRPAGLALALLLLAGPALAASICGTVRDAQTSAPVEGAAIFLFDAGDTWTGLHAASAADGTYCLDGVAPGTYSLQVRRDDYLIAVVPGILVDEAVAVDIDAVTRVLLADPWPNPGSEHVVLRFRVAPGAPLSLSIHDVAGRHVRTWTGVGSGHDRTLDWRFVDHRGASVASGTYLVTLRAYGQQLVRRVSLVR